MGCAIASEACNGNACKCGTHETCEDKSYGSICDDSNNICKCTASLTCEGEGARNGTQRGEFCDVSANNGNGACKCTASVDFCPLGETCSTTGSGSCKCGTGTSCVGQTETGELCHENVCKCSISEGPCTDGHTCVNEECKCGTGAKCSTPSGVSYTNICQDGVCGKLIEIL